MPCCKVPSNVWYKVHQIPKLNCFLSRLSIVLAQSIDARCKLENEDVVGAAPTGDAPTTFEWSTVLLPTKVWLILEFDSRHQAGSSHHADSTLTYDVTQVITHKVYSILQSINRPGSRYVGWSASLLFLVTDSDTTVLFELTILVV